MPAVLQAHQDIVLDTREPSQMEQQRKVLQVRARLQQQAYGPAARLAHAGALRSCRLSPLLPCLSFP